MISDPRKAGSMTGPEDQVFHVRNKDFFSWEQALPSRKINLWEVENG